MSRIAFFCIPAHGHTNPTLPVVRALCDMGHEVRYYSFEAFRGEIGAAGATFVSCDGYDMGGEAATGAEVARDIEVSTRLIVRATLAMDADITRQLEAWRPDVIVGDSVAYWAKLIAMKLGIPFVCSCTTFAFNRYSSRIMKQGLGDLLRLLWKLPRTKKLMKPLRDAGYPAENLLAIVQNDDHTDTVVYTSREFQPAAETFSDRYAFVGPVLRAATEAVEKPERPLIYISMGTVINGDDAFLRRCLEAFGDGRYEVIISAGEGADIAALGTPPAHVRVLPRVDQVAVLRAADAFVTHCGMNSVSEALYFGVPLVMRPLTPEEGGVAVRVGELGAGVPLEKDDAAGLRRAVERVLNDPKYREAAAKIGEGFGRCGGAQAAAEKILAVARG